MTEQNAAMRPVQPAPRPQARRKPLYKRTLFWVQIAVVLAMVVGAWASLRGAVQEPEGAAPSHIGDFKRTGVVTGEAAMQQMQQMHIGDIGIMDGYVANYELSAEKMTLWVGTTGTESDARQLLDRMVSAIGKGGTPFTKPVSTTVDGRQMYSTSGAGGMNYFFQDKHSVVWVLFVNSPMPASRLTDVLRNVRFD